MTNKPLQYDSLRTVLRYIRPELRMEICLRMPTIRKTDKALPLRLDKIDLSASYLWVNKCLYSFTIFREYPPGSEIPNNHKHELKYGIDRFELDQAGRKYVDTEVTPGDVIIGDPLSNVKPDEPPLPPFTPCLQFRKQYKTQTTRASIHKYRYPYLWKRSQAMKKLMTLLFGGRRYAIEVQKLSVNMSNDILRLPVGIRFKISSLHLSSPIESTCLALKNVIEDSNNPLQELSVFSRNVDLNSPILKSAEKLVVCGWMNNFPELLPTCVNLRNPFVQLCMNEINFQIESLFDLIQNWAQSDRSVGMIFTYDCVRRLNVRRFLNMLEQQLGGTIVRDVIAWIPMDENRALKVFLNKNNPWERVSGIYTVALRVMAARIV